MPLGLCLSWLSSKKEYQKQNNVKFLRASNSQKKLRDFEQSNIQKSMVALKRAFGVLKSSMNRSKCERTYPIDGWKSFEEGEEEFEVTDK